jgi:hypothetical protein
MQALKRAVILSAFLSLPAWAMPPATVAAVQAPAWLERGGRIQPLAVGMSIENGDRIRTGEEARAYLALAEGSTVKLGADSRLAFFNMSIKPRKEYRGALDVVNGSLRLSTNETKRVKRRELTIRVGGLTARTDGTDVWGRSDPTEDTICLMEGQLQLWHVNALRVVPLAQPMTCVTAAKGRSPKPMAAVDAEELSRRLRTTEIDRGAGASRASGKVRVLLGIYKSEAEVLGQYDIARSAGFAVSIKPVPSEGGGWNYQLLATRFPDAEEAAAAAARLKAATGIEAVTTR